MYEPGGGGRGTGEGGGGRTLLPPPTCPYMETRMDWAVGTFQTFPILPLPLLPSLISLQLDGEHWMI